MHKIAIADVDKKTFIYGILIKSRNNSGFFNSFFAVLQGEPFAADANHCGMGEEVAVQVVYKTGFDFSTVAKPQRGASEVQVDGKQIAHVEPVAPPTAMEDVASVAKVYFIE